MTVKDLQNQLNKFDPNMDIICTIEDEVFTADRKPIMMFEIVSVEETEAEWQRRDNGMVYPKYGKSETSRKMITLSITSDL